MISAPVERWLNGILPRHGEVKLCHVVPCWTYLCLRFLIFFLWVHLRSRILPMTQVWKGTKTASLPRCKWWFSDFFSNLPITGKACRGGTSTRGTKLDEKHPEGLWLFQILWSCIKGGKKRLQIQFHFLQTHSTSFFLKTSCGLII